MILRMFKNLSLKAHLVIGVTLVHTLLMAIFVYDLVHKQKMIIEDQHLEDATALSRTISASSSTWVLARDFAGMNEIVSSLKTFQDLEYAFIYTPEGKVLAHSNEKFVGKYLSDKHLNSKMHGHEKKYENEILVNNDKLVDVETPIYAEDKIVAFVRVGINKATSLVAIDEVIIKGIIYSVLAILVGLIMSLMIGDLITKKLNALVELSSKVKEGNHSERAVIDSENEIGKLGLGINSMLDSLEKDRLEKDRLYHQLQQTQKMEAVGQLTGGIAHDFNNILAGLMGFTELSIKRVQHFENRDEKLEKQLGQIMKLSHRARDLIRQMLIFSRGGDPIPKVINTIDVIDESISMIQPLLPSTIVVEKEFIGPLSKIKIDPIQLQQIIMNLCINARDAIDGKNAKITLRVSEDHCDFKNCGICSRKKLNHTSNCFHQECTSCGAKMDGDWVKIEITDTGPGIPYEIQKKIFDPFFSTKAPGKGIGMGLSMVHGIVHRHGGHIMMHSTPGLGTSIYIIMPIAKELDAESVENNELITETTQDRKRVLVVDDEPEIRMILKEFLIDEGHEVDEAENGKIAFEKIKHDDSYDLMITDYTMPIMNGLELIDITRSSSPHIAIILSSGNLDMNLEEQIEKYKLEGILLKPYQVTEALMMIHSVFKMNDRKNKKAA